MTGHEHVPDGTQALVWVGLDPVPFSCVRHDGKWLTRPDVDYPNPFGQDGIVRVEVSRRD